MSLCLLHSCAVTNGSSSVTLADQGGGGRTVFRTARRLTAAAAGQLRRRRRIVRPVLEGLEGRALLALFTPSTAAILEVPRTFAQSIVGPNNAIANSFP